MRLSIVESKNAKQYYVIESIRTNGKNTTRIVEKLGTHEQLLKIHNDPEAWAKEYVTELNRKKNDNNQKILVPYSPDRFIEKDKVNLYDGGYLFLQKIYYDLGIDGICQKISAKHRFEYNLNHILSRLLYERILNPSSKLSTYTSSQSLIEKPDFNLQSVYRSLEVITQEKDFIQSELYKNSLAAGKRNDRVLYYDCTNYYFEIEREDGIRKFGVSKENRPNPIVEMGLFMDGDGVPLAFNIHAGNTNEQKTLKPLEAQIIKDFGHSKFVVCTDAGLSSVSNRKFNDISNRAFITAQSIKKMKAFQKEWALSPEGWRLPGTAEVFNLNNILSDDKLIEKYRLRVFFKEQWFNENDIDQRYIVTFSINYMFYQRGIRNEQIERAKNAIKSETKSERTRQTDYKRFITKTAVTENGEVAAQKVYELNTGKIEEEERFDGFYAVATNLEDSAEDIIKINKKRWEIEECFRIMKSEFKARPVFLSRDDRITAHFLTCFLALVIFRYIEKLLGHKYTCSEIITGLRNMRFQQLPSDGYVPVYTRTDFTDDLHNAFGFRTDYEIISKSKMKNIISSTKKG